MAEERFQALRTVANLIAGIGWLVIFGVVLAFLIVLTEGGGVGTLVATGYLVGGIILGLVLVANGQLLKCIRAIEHNTRVRGESRPTRTSDERQGPKPPEASIVEREARPIALDLNRLIIGLAVPKKDFKETVRSIVTLFPLLRVVYEDPNMGVVEVALPKGTNIEEMIQWLESIPTVSYVEPESGGVGATGSADEAH